MYLFDFILLNISFIIPLDYKIYVKFPPFNEKARHINYIISEVYF